MLHKIEIIGEIGFAEGNLRGLKTILTNNNISKDDIKQQLAKCKEYIARAEALLNAPEPTVQNTLKT